MEVFLVLGLLSIAGAGRLGIVHIYAVSKVSTSNQHVG